MINWKNAEIVELDIAMTAYGGNPKAREANANKHPNNGKGGSIVVDTPVSVPTVDGDTTTAFTTDSLS